MVLCRADITSKNEAKVERYLRNYDVVVQKLKDVEERLDPQFSATGVRGGDHGHVRHPPFRPVGDIKNAIKEAILDGDIKNDPVEAKQLMLRLGQEMGLTLSPSNRP